MFRAVIVDGIAYSGGVASPDQVNFLLFTAVWTLIAIAYLALSPVYKPQWAHKYAIVAVDAVTMVFWFAGFIALAVLVTELSLCFGNVCHAAQAAIVFAAFTWYVYPSEMKMLYKHRNLRQASLSFLLEISALTSDTRLLFVATTVLAAMHVWRTRQTSDPAPAHDMEVRAPESTKV